MKPIYKEYPTFEFMSEIRKKDYSFLVNLTMEEADQLDVSWNDFRKEISEVKRYNDHIHHNAKSELIDHLKSIGISVGTQYRDDDIKYFAHIKKLFVELKAGSYNEPYISSRISTGENFYTDSNTNEKVTFHINMSPAGFRYAWGTIQNKNRELATNNKRYQKAAEYLLYNKLTDLIDVHDVKGTIEKADNIAREIFAKENIIDGEEHEISCCDECNTATVGERRCSCGNRRIDFYVDGELENYYVVSEAY